MTIQSEVLLSKDGSEENMWDYTYEDNCQYVPIAAIQYILYAIEKKVFQSAKSSKQSDHD